MEELNKLKDIKGIEEIDITNPLWYLLAIVVVLLILFAIWYNLTHRKKRYKFKKSKEELALERIKNINYSDSKSVAYTFSKDVEQFVNEQNMAEYKEIELMLNSYKYKKESKPLEKAIESRVKAFIKGIL